MKYFIKQNTCEGSVLFCVYDELGQPIYCVEGDSGTLSSKYYIYDTHKNETAKITKFDLPTFARYDISIQDKECGRILETFTSGIPVFKIKGINWHFRGDMALRSFDVLDVANSVIMTHGRCWGKNGDCFAIDVHDDKDAVLCLCIAIVIDSIVMGGIGSVVPAGN